MNSNFRTLLLSQENRQILQLVIFLFINFIFIRKEILGYYQIYVSAVQREVKSSILISKGEAINISSINLLDPMLLKNK
ncbi:hypothetical protein BpHYR1_047901 [Brachionus plicatilis]|uniref:Uncharacterized protein n=1 Tax=Brachionus plicatilis TaxID=10195 RepID=A0A3M7PHZ8_BRAPC|nr:hypothetical protein BpHYR1_047901 [Brachionus plicatilis]